jgi:hypothetical protein
MLRVGLIAHHFGCLSLRQAPISVELKLSENVLMPKVKFISSSTEIPAGQNYVLVKYGEVYGEARHPLGLTITVARNQSKTINDLSFLTAVHSAKGIAKREGISTIFACK